jgi:hypothetical protein
MNYTTDDLEILGYHENVVLPRVRAVCKSFNVKRRNKDVNG